MTTPTLGKIWVVGFGQMGQALVRGWLDQGLCAPADITAIDPSGPAVQQAKAWGVNWAATQPATDWPHVVLFALKPQTLLGIVPDYHAVARAGSLCISIAAGTTISQLRTALEGGAVVRAMPNTPAQIRQGMTVCCAGPGLLPAQQQLAERLFMAVGAVAWVEDEEQLNAVTALSGSGPAYLFYLAEAMVEAGVKLGLSHTLAQQLTQQTLAGAAALAAARQATQSYAALRAAVTSPGGTTAAAVEVLNQHQVAALWQQAINAACARSVALSATTTHNV